MNRTADGVFQALDRRTVGEAVPSGACLVRLGDFRDAIYTEIGKAYQRCNRGVGWQ